MHRRSRVVTWQRTTDHGSASRTKRTSEARSSRVEQLQRGVGNEAVYGLTRSFAGARPASLPDALRSPGQPLPPAVRKEMEARFGADFSDVQVHVGDAAERSAARQGAQAYSVGRHIVFGRGRYKPETIAGNALLAHELAHVVQQSRGGVAPSSEPNWLIEQDARQAAAAATQGDCAVHVEAASGIGVARQDDDISFEERVRRELHDELLKELFASPASAAGGSAPSANQPLLSLLNGPFFGGNNPVGTLSTDIFGVPFALQSTTDPSVGPTWVPSLTLQVRDRTSLENEWGVFGSLGGAVPFGAPRNPAGQLSSSGGPSPTTTGALGLSLHHGPEAPSDKENYVFGWGYWLTLGQSWGLEPKVPGLAPRGWSLNPTATGMLSLGWARAEHGEADLILGTGLSRWGQVNGVPAGAFLSPYAGFSYTWNLSDADSLYAEILAASNLGLAGRFDAGTGFPVSGFVAGGVGYQHTWGDYGFGVEPWVFTEPWSNVSTPAAEGFPAGPAGNIGFGLRFNLTGINPRRRQFLDE